MSEISTKDKSKVLKSLNPSKIFIPIAISLAITGYLFYKDAGQIPWGKLQEASILWIILAVLTLVVRDALYIYRIRYITHKNLSWTSSFYSIMLWEFSSAVSPSAVGGTALATIVLMKEGLSFGKSMAYVMTTAILDNMFFLVAGAIVMLLYYSGMYDPANLFVAISGAGMTMDWEYVRYMFFISYALIGGYTLFMTYGLFINPHIVKWVFVKVTGIKWLRRFQPMAEKQGNEMVLASKAIRGTNFTYWARAIGTTCLIWSARYLIVNCLIAAFVVLTPAMHGFVFSRHVVLWVVLLVGITPGAAGFAELAFKAFFQQFAGAFVLIAALIWRIATFYPYLLFGAIFLPRWVKRVFFKDKEPESDKATEQPINKSE
ncbi:lysylphosphatidylglycerol synthase transmembrane domain-containing protein [Microscilla marina]|uniref:Membrane protein, putative n=1 Tax=Microscilla marina ATCC 23134 TaxID=313606 RepID=A1ZKU2_MICM2|nr:lysylphosphatidylglycerol synthase transmembrane domain-containing protein [Microscilla marina]EAY28908.1 membrane protein, putative [Microscilla marina ATCC 23134]